MENTKSTFTPEESLQLISRTIEGYKSAHKRNNYYFLLWGWVITLACITHFALLRIFIDYEKFDGIELDSWLLWGLFILVGFTVQFIHIHRIKKQTTVRSHLERYMSILWQVSSATMLVAGLISYLLHIYPGPLVFTIAGLATLVTGLQTQFKPLMLGGFILLGSAITACFFRNEYQLLVNAGGILFGYLIPGYMLKTLKS